jgi:hypothetical protein
MPLKTFKLLATVSSDNPAGVRVPLERFLGTKAKIGSTDDGFAVEATLVGIEARELNRRLLSDMRGVEKKTRLRAEWTSDGVTERFFDYVLLKGRRDT